MSKVTVQVEISKSADTIGHGLYNLVVAAKNAMADGWQPGRDVPALVMAAAGELMTIVGAIGSIPGDVTEDKIAFLQGLELHGAKMAKLFL